MTTTQQFLAATDGSRTALDEALESGIVTADEWFAIAADLKAAENRSARVMAVLDRD